MNDTKSKRIKCFTPETTIGALTESQLNTIAESRNDVLLDFLEETTLFDVDRIRVILELGIETAKEKLSNIEIKKQR